MVQTQPTDESGFCILWVRARRGGGARQLRGIPKIVRSAFVTVVLLLSLQTIVVPTFLNFDKRYPDQIFTLVIWGGDRSKFGDPETVYRGKRVCVTG